MVETERHSLRAYDRENGEKQPTYDPRTLVTLADQKAFSAWLPYQVNGLYRMSLNVLANNYLQENDISAARSIGRLSTIAQILACNGAYALQEGIYAEFLLSIDPPVELPRYQPVWTENGYQSNGSIQYLGHLKEQPSEFQEAWKEFLTTGKDISRERALKIVGEYGPDVYKNPYRLPYRPGTDNPEVVGFWQTFARIPYQFSLEIFPDLTDQEAGELFYETSVEEVRALASGMR